MSGTYGALRLIELTSARLCHDIGGPAGALDHVFPVSGGGSARKPDLEKAVLNTAQALTNRLELRRAAWGPEGEPVSLERLRFLARGLPEKMALSISALSPGTVFSASAGRIVLNLLLLAADSLPSGGTLMLAGAADDVFAQITGPAAAWPIGMAVCFADQAEARSALNEWHSHQMGLTALLAHAAGIRLSMLLTSAPQSEPAILRLGG